MIHVLTRRSHASFFRGSTHIHYASSDKTAMITNGHEPVQCFGLVFLLLLPLVSDTLYTYSVNVHKKQLIYRKNKKHPAQMCVMTFLDSKDRVCFLSRFLLFLPQQVIIREQISHHDWRVAANCRAGQRSPEAGGNRSLLTYLLCLCEKDCNHVI